VDNRTGDRLLHWFRRLRIRREIRHEIHEAFMTLTAAIICWRHRHHRGHRPRPGQAYRARLHHHVGEPAVCNRYLLVSQPDRLRH
jgi:hypothetical protein